VLSEEILSDGCITSKFKLEERMEDPSINSLVISPQNDPTLVIGDFTPTSARMINEFQPNRSNFITPELRIKAMNNSKAKGQSTTKVQKKNFFNED